MIPFYSLLILALTVVCGTHRSFAFFQTQASALAKDVKAKTDLVLDQLNIEKTEVVSEFPKAGTKANLKQVQVDLEKIKSRIEVAGPGRLVDRQFSIESPMGKTLFRSCRNKIEVTALENGLSIAHEVVSEPPGAAIVQPSSSEAGKWLVQVLGGSQVQLKVFKAGTQTVLGHADFKVVSLPIPAVGLNTAPMISIGTSSIGSAQFKANSGLELTYPAQVTDACLDFERHEILEYKYAYFPRGGNRITGQVTGRSFSTIRSLIQQASPSEQFQFFEIKLSHPDLALPAFGNNFFVTFR